MHEKLQSSASCNAGGCFDISSRAGVINLLLYVAIVAGLSFGASYLVTILHLDEDALAVNVLYGAVLVVAIFYLPRKRFYRSRCAEPRGGDGGPAC